MALGHAVAEIAREARIPATALPSATFREVQVQQLPQRFVLTDVRIPPVGPGHGGVEARTFLARMWGAGKQHNECKDAVPRAYDG